MSYNPCSQLFFQQPILFSEVQTSYLSKLRIIQKNLVHFQGFPDELYDKNLLISPEYFGQYGNIIKIALVSKEDKLTKKRTNSAYLTFETKEQAAYCILSVDSIKIKDQLVRAFFGTTKYCNHFLNNFHCFNEDKCMFLHYLADSSDIIGENTKFGYSDHIKLAKKIIFFGSIQSEYYAMNTKTPNNPKLPPIKTIYQKEEIVAKSKNHRRNISDSSNNSTNNSNSCNNINSSNSYSDINPKEETQSQNINIQNKDISCQNSGKSSSLFKSKSKSRFFNNINNISNTDNLNIGSSINDPINKLYESNGIRLVIDSLAKRFSFFNSLEKYPHLKNIQSLKELEVDYCKLLQKKTKDIDIKSILEYKY